MVVGSVSFVAGEIDVTSGPGGPAHAVRQQTITHSLHAVPDIFASAVIGLYRSRFVNLCRLDLTCCHVPANVLASDQCD